MRALLLLVASAAALPPLPAQGGIRWSDPGIRPILHVREYANGEWGLCFDGWSTTGGTPFLNDGEAAAVGNDPGARTVTSSSSEFLRGGSGGPANVLFPFAPDARVLPIFRPTAPALDWFGFLAPNVGPVPDRYIGSLCFRVGLAQPLPWSVLRPMFGSSRAGVALADSMGNQTGQRYVLAPQAVRAAAICAYEFDRGAGTQTINYAGIEGGALANGLLTRAGGGSPWAPGRSGFALRGGAACDSGWSGDLGGRFSVAWAMRRDTAPSGTSPIFALDGFRAFTGGPAGNGLRCTGWGGMPAALDLNVNVQALAAAGWVHVALVVDGDLGQATWYVNGTARPPIAITGRPSIPRSGFTLLIGSVGALASDYHLDEFRLVNDAADAATVAAWVAGSPAQSAPYSITCGASLRADGVPSVGSSTFALRVEALPGSGVQLTLGVGSSLGQIPLPIDLGLLDPGLAGCPWFSDLAALLPPLVVPASGVLVVPLAIPPNTALRGLEVHAQALAVEPGGAKRATNALGVSIE